MSVTAGTFAATDAGRKWLSDRHLSLHSAVSWCSAHKLLQTSCQLVEAAISWGRIVSARITCRVGSCSTATLALYSLISLHGSVGSCRWAYAAEARSNAKPGAALATMSDRVAPSNATHGIPLKVFPTAHGSELASNLGSTTSAHLVSELTLCSLDAALVTPRPMPGVANLEELAHQQGSWGALRATRGARGGAQPASRAAMAPPMTSFALGDAVNRPNVNQAPPWSRGSETSVLAAVPSVAAMGGVHHAAVFSAAAVIEPVNSTIPISSRSHMTFPSDPASGPFQPIGRPFENGSNPMNRVR